MGTPDELRPLFLLSDEPIGISVDDGLGMNQTARVIAEAALGAATPFTVGIFGAWGHGKTSLLNAARTLLEPVKSDGTITRPHPHVVTVQFNAWRYEKEEHPIVPLVASIAKAVKLRLDEDRSFGQAVGEKGKAIAATLYDGAVSLIGALKAEAGGKAGVPFVAEGEVSLGVDGEALQKNLAERQAKRVAAAQPRVQSWIDKSLYLSAFDDLARLHASAKGSGANQTGTAPVIVVFIDDLDRCRPEAAVEILEGIKLVLAQPGFVFVVALYREVIERYLDRQSEIRYGEKHKGIGEGYIDKIVQLPLWLPSHEAAFEKYIRRLIDTKLAVGLLPGKREPKDPGVVSVEALLETVRKSVPLLARLSAHSPRKLVRKINELLIDDRLLPDEAYRSLGCKPEEQRAILFPLCLIQRALLEMPLPHQIKPLLENNDLCTALARYRRDLTDKSDDDGNVAPMLFREALTAKVRASSPREGKPALFGGTPAPIDKDPALKDLDAATAARWLRATDCLSLNEARAVLLNTRAGRDWLGNHAARRLVARAIVTHAETAAPTPPKADEAVAMPKSGGGVVVSPQASTSASNEELRQQIAVIERAARKSLTLKESDDLTPDRWAQVEILELSHNPITDRGAAWLTHPDRGLKALSTLGLGGTKVTDSGVKELARADTGLKALTSLYLYSTTITDAGIKDLARADTALKALTSLVLGGTKVTDAGLKDLARADTGLKALTTLYLGSTEITDAGVKDLATTDTGLKALTELYLGGTKVTDAGIEVVKARFPEIKITR